MEAHLEAQATPARVRNAMRRHGLAGYGISKANGTWYVFGGEAATWKSTSLNTDRLDGKSVAYWIQQMQTMQRAGWEAAKQQTERRDKAMADIAQNFLSIHTLETRKSDFHDFHEVAVWSLKDALLAAYEIGLAAGREQAQTGGTK
jgi:hypothetical protein